MLEVSFVIVGCDDLFNWLLVWFDDGLVYLEKYW